MIKVLNRTEKIWILIILLTTAGTYAFSLSFDFVNFDDYELVLFNPNVMYLSVQGVVDTFTTYNYGLYHPVTTLSFAIDNAIGGGSPWVFHLVNVLLHLLNTYLVFRMVRLLSKNDIITIIVSFLFGLHTLHVESVVWISERKDVLYTAFFLLSLIQYIRYLESEKRKHYYLALILFILSLFSKGQALTLTIIIIAIDYLYQRKILSFRTVVEKLPFIVLSVIFGLIAISSQEYLGETPFKAGYSIADRLAFAAYGLCEYFIKTIAPVDLSAFYPYPERINGSIPGVYKIYGIAAFIILVLQIVLILKSKNAYKTRLLSFALLFYIISISIVLRWVPSDSAFNTFIIADRYMYVASIGIFLMIAIFINYLVTKWIRLKSVMFMALALCLAALSYLTISRSMIWKNSITLWTSVLEENPRLEWALEKRGAAFMEHKEYENAINDFSRIVKLRPELYFPYYLRGKAYYEADQQTKALQDINIAVKKAPPEDFIKKNAYLSAGFSDIYYIRAMIYFNAGYKDQGCGNLRKASDLGNEEARMKLNTDCDKL